MLLLVLGLLVFLGGHSVRIVADDWRAEVIRLRGEAVWKGASSVLALVGFALIVWGFGTARQQPVLIWSPPLAMRHVAALLMLLAFILLTAAFVPRNQIRARLHHPMVLSVKVWALAHLLANGTLAHLVLFGAFLLWAVVDFASCRRRDRRNATVYPAGRLSATLLTVGIGVLAWLLFAFVLHGWLIGVRPFG